MKRYSLYIIILFFLAACGKHKKQTQMDFTSIQYYDASGNSQGSTGDVSKQYIQEKWDKWQYDLFLTSDTLARDTTALADITDAKLYPNPVTDTACFSFTINNKAMFRAVIIDNKRKIHWNTALNLSSGHHRLSIDFAGSHIPTGYYRIYYSLSAIGYSHYFRAHADIQKL